MFYVVTGGSGSGKSEYAEQLICGMGNAERYYIATMQADDAESRQRIKKHQNMRAGKQFVTVECFRDLQELFFLKNGNVLLECMSNLAANEMFADNAEETEVAARTESMEKTESAARAENVQGASFFLESRAVRTEDKILRGIENIRKQARHLVVVTNEIFSDGAHYDPWTRAYQKCLAAINKRMAAQADHVIEVVYGQICIVK